MATRTVYYAGGFDPSKPAGNIAEQLDGAAGTYTAWNAAGAVTAQRPLTADEAASLATLDASNAQVATADTLRQQAIAAMVVNRTFIAAAKPSTAAAQASAAYDQAVRNARMLNGLARIVLDLRDGTD